MLKSWEVCNGGDRQSIASFLGSGGTTPFGKQEAALHYSQRLYWGVVVHMPYLVLLPFQGLGTED